MRKIIQRDVDGFKGYTTHRPGYDTVRPARYIRIHVSEDDFLGFFWADIKLDSAVASGLTFEHKIVRSPYYIFAANNLIIKIWSNRRLFLRRPFARCIYHIRIHILASVNVKFFYLLLHPYFILLHIPTTYTLCCRAFEASRLAISLIE